MHASDSYFATIQRPPDFAVPKTFGMSAILGIMTALALLFAVATDECRAGAFTSSLVVWKR